VVFRRLTPAAGETAIDLETGEGDDLALGSSPNAAGLTFQTDAHIIFAV